MSEFLPLRITRSNADRGVSAGRVLLEQEPWDPYVGYLTKGGAVAYLRGLLFGEADQELPATNCGIDVAAGGITKGTVYAYPDPPELGYLLALSHGTVSGHSVEFLNFAEVVHLQNEIEPALRYPTRRIVSAEWLGSAMLGALPAAGMPAIAIAGGRVKASAPIYGSMLVVYEVVRHIYAATVTPRLEAAQNKYQSYIYAVWDGGNNYLEYKPPADAEESQSSAAAPRCNLDWLHGGTGTAGGAGYGSNTDIVDSDDPQVTAPALGDIERLWDYCSNSEVPV